MSKKLLSLLLAMVMLVSAFGFSAAAEEIMLMDTSVSGGGGSSVALIAEGDINESLWWTLDVNGLLTIAGNGAMPDYPSNGSGIPWSGYLNDILSLRVERGVTYVGQYAFLKCVNMTDAYIANTVDTIASYAFSTCSALASITMSSSVTAVKWGAFYVCNNLKTINYTGTAAQFAAIKVSSANTCFTKATVKYVSPIEAVELSSSVLLMNSGDVEYISANVICAEDISYTATWKSSDDSVATVVDGEVTAVSSGSAIITVTVENVTASCAVTVLSENIIASGVCGEKLTWVLDTKGVLNISGEGDMYNWSSVTKPDWINNYKGLIKDIKITGNNISIGQFAFYGISGLSEIVIGDDVVKIGAMAFSNCTKAKRIVIGDSVTKIGNSAFEACKAATEVILGRNLVELGQYVFSNCWELNTIWVPKSITKIGWGASYKCDNLKTINYEGTAAEWAKIAISDANGCILSATKNYKQPYPTPVIETYDVVFMVDDAEYTVKTLNVGESLTTDEFPAVPYKNGYTGMWDVDWDITEETTVTAVYTPIAVENVYLNEYKLDLTTGDTFTLKATIYPENALSKTVRWTSSNKSIATVSNGLVTAVSPGIATITATAGGVSATCSVVVNPDTFEVIFIADETEYDVITVNAGDFLSPDEFPEVPYKEGYIGMWDADWDITEATTVTAIYIAIPVEEIYLNVPAVTLTKGDTYALEVTIIPDDALDQTVVWESSDETVATVEDGLVTAIAPGTATITATVDGKSAECEVTVNPDTFEVVFIADEIEYDVFTVNAGDSLSPDEFPEVPYKEGYIGMWDVNWDITEATTVTAIYTAILVDEVYLNVHEITITQGDTYTLEVTIIPDDALDQTVVWESSDEEIAIVEDGIVTAIAPGTATITATVGGKSASCEVTVNPNLFDVVFISDDGIEIAKFTRAIGEVVSVDEFPTVPARRGYKGYWNVNEDITETTTVYAVYRPILVDGIELNTRDIELEIGDLYTIIAAIDPSDALDQNIVWTSSDEAVATVENGLVTAVTPGKATITASISGFSANCLVTVKEPHEGPSVTLSKGTTIPGGVVELVLNIDKNTGFSNLSIQLEYDESVMGIEEVRENSTVGAVYTPAQEYSKYPYNMSWNSITNNDFNGTLATIRFRVREDAPVGDHTVAVSYYTGIDRDYIDGENVNYDENFKSLNLNYEPGVVYVPDHIAGDINGDCMVDNRDATILQRYLAGWTFENADYKVNMFALDVDGNGSVDNKDATVLLRYLAGWDVKIY